MSMSNRRCPVGHRLWERAKYFCTVCYNRKRYYKKRKLGFPSWRAKGYTMEGRLNDLDGKIIIERRAVLDGSAAKRHKRHRDKMKRLYGGDPASNIVARLRQLIAKEKQNGR